MRYRGQGYTEVLVRANQACTFAQFITDIHANWDEKLYHPKMARANDGQAIRSSILMGCDQKIAMTLVAAEPLSTHDKVGVAMLALQQSFLELQKFLSDPGAKKMMTQVSTEIADLMCIVRAAQEASIYQDMGGSLN